jgi:hypothetical protein
MSPKLTPLRPTQEDAANLMRVVREAVRSGARAGMTSYNEIAEMLNAKGIAAPQARRWTAQSVATVLGRAREARSECRRVAGCATPTGSAHAGQRPTLN